MQKILEKIVRRVIGTLAVLLLWGYAFVPVSAASEVTVTHSHTGDGTSGGGCYGQEISHVHQGDSGQGGGCYTVPIFHSHGGGCYTSPVYHSHTGSSASGDGCYTTAIYHAHTGDTEKGEGCYTAPVYHVHDGDERSGGGCYTEAVYHKHSGNPGQSYANGCYTVKSESLVPRHCGSFVNDGDGFWHCNNCGVRTPDSNVPSDQAHAPYETRISYSLGCGKNESTPEKYNKTCGKDESTVEGYDLNCGKTEETVEGYQLSCGKNEQTVEKHDLGCGKTEQTAERYETGCTPSVTYALNCGKKEGEPLGKLSLIEKEGDLSVSAKGLTVQEYQWSTGESGEKLQNIKPETTYSCKVTFTDGMNKRSEELTITTAKKKPLVKQPVKVPWNEMADSQIAETQKKADFKPEDLETEESGEISGEGSLEQVFAEQETDKAQILRQEELSNDTEHETDSETARKWWKNR